MKRKWINYNFIFTAAAILIIWGIYASNNSPIIAPSPLRVLKALYRIVSGKAFFLNISLTLYRGLAGYFITIILGLFLGLLMGRYDAINKSIDPFVSGLNAIPRISWIMLAMIWFPLNSALVIFIIVITILPTITIGVVDGYKEVPKDLLEVGRIYKFSSYSITTNNYFPAMLPFILSSSRVAAGLTWKSIIMAELLTVDRGMGAAMGSARAALATDQVIAYTILIIIICALHQSLIKGVEKKLRANKYEGKTVSEQAA